MFWWSLHSGRLVHLRIKTPRYGNQKLNFTASVLYVGKDMTLTYTHTSITCKQLPLQVTGLFFVNIVVTGFDLTGLHLKRCTNDKNTNNAINQYERIHNITPPEKAIKTKKYKTSKIRFFLKRNVVSVNNTKVDDSPQMNG